MLKKLLGLLFALAMIPALAFGLDMKTLHPEEFPWKPPYTADQLAFLEDATYFPAVKNYDCDALEIEVDARGYIRQRATMRKRLQRYDDYRELLDFKDGTLKPGAQKREDIIFMLTPPQLKNQTLLSWTYKETPDVRKMVDWWIYIPALRQVRRLATGERSDGVAGGDMTYDDIVGREPFDETHTLLGEDTLPADDIIPEPVDCYVVKAVHTDPGYYLGKRIVWIDKKRFIRWREEQYDKKGNLWKIFERRMEPQGKDAVLDHTNWYDWNVQKHFRQWVRIFNVSHGGDFKEREFEPNFLRKEYTWRVPDIGAYPYIKSPKDLPKLPPLLEGRFPSERKWEIPEETKRLIEKERKEGKGA